MQRYVDLRLAQKDSVMHQDALEVVEERGGAKGGSGVGAEEEEERVEAAHFLRNAKSASVGAELPKRSIGTKF